jgi:dTDP-4-dehydrorhamnose reductase
MITQYAKDNKVKLIHISTDYVFDGTSAVALTEEAKHNPINVYGALLKEQVNWPLLRVKSDTIIIRTSWVLQWVWNNFVKQCSSCEGGVIFTCS